MIKIALMGKMRSGKDTVAEIIDQEIGHEIPCEQYAFADGIKDVLLDYFLEDVIELDKQGKKPRHHLQHIGQEFRKLNEGVWIGYLDRTIKANAHLHKYRGFADRCVIITDVRQPNEHFYVKNLGYHIIKIDTEDEIRVKRMEDLNQVDDSTAEQMQHETEKYIDSLNYDYVIRNNGSLEDLKQSTKRVLQDIMKKEGSKRNG